MYAMKTSTRQDNLVEIKRTSEDIDAYRLLIIHNKIN